jgi:Domain of unknown function (DUF4386)
MIERVAAAGPNPSARTTGAVYLLYFLTAISGALMGHHFPALGKAVTVLSMVCYAVLAVLLYRLFRPVNRSVSMLAAFFSLAGCVVATLGLFHIAARYVNPLLFFAIYCLLIGTLILRSTFLPRILGALMALAGVGWLVFLIPSLSKPLSIGIMALGILAEAALMLWLLVKGVNVQRWQEQSAAIHS